VTSGVRLGKLLPSVPVPGMAGQKKGAHHAPPGCIVTVVKLVLGTGGSIADLPVRFLSVLPGSVRSSKQPWLLYRISAGEIRVAALEHNSLPVPGLEALARPGHVSGAGLSAPTTANGEDDGFAQIVVAAGQDITTIVTRVIPGEVEIEDPE